MPRTRKRAPRVIHVLAAAIVAVAVLAAAPAPVGAETPSGAPGLPRRAAAVLDAGGAHTCARLADGSVKCWGANDFGQLGQGDTANRGDEFGEMGDDLRAVALGAGRTAIAVAAGEDHSCALLDDRSVKCWGLNDFGQLGRGATEDLGDEVGEMGDNLPAVDLGAGRTAVAIAAGEHQTCAVLDDGTAKCWGLNHFGQLGQGDTANRGDQPGEMGDLLLPIPLGAGRTATAIAVALAHTCAVLDDGSAKCWGANSFGQLGQGDVASRGGFPGEMGDALLPIDVGAGRTVRAITGGNAHTCAVLDDGSAKCWGWNLAGQLGHEDIESSGDEPGEMGDQLAPTDVGGPVTAISAGVVHTCVVLVSADVKCWGNNQSGRLGQEHSNTLGDAPGEMGVALSRSGLGTGRTATAISAGNQHSCALLDDLTVKCWGSALSGQLGQKNTTARGDNALEMGDNLLAIDLGTLGTVIDVAAGGAHTCALLAPGTVKCWGDNASGQLGYGDTFNRGDVAGQMGAALPAVQLGTGRSAIAIAAGNAHTCALLDNGSVKCWGENSSGQLGQGDTADRGDALAELGDNLPAVDLGTGRTATAITAAAGHSCALLDNGTVKCWGQNGTGQLGQGHTQTEGNGPGEMGDSLLTVTLLANAVAISAGELHTCALLAGGGVTCWGQNVLGQLGQGNANNLGDAPADVLDAIDLGTGRTATAVAAAGYHSCAVLDDATAKCWGANASGQLGQGDAATRGDGAGEMGDALDAIDLGTGRTATAIGAGLEHSCAVLDDGSAKCWGENGVGQLGLDDASDRGNAVGEMGDALDPIDVGTGRRAVRVEGGAEHTCTLLDTAALRCWGANAEGQLGQGDTDTRGDLGGDMAALEPVRLAGRAHVPPITDVPLAPAGPTAIAAIGGATVTWMVPTDNGGRPIAGYRVQSAPSLAGPWTTQISDTASIATSASVSGLAPGAPVHFRVAAITAVGIGAYSVPSPAVVPLASPPTPPGPPGPVPPGPVPPAVADLVTLPPARLLDTRQPSSTIDGLHAGGGAVPAGAVIEVQIAGRAGVPADALAAVLNTTAVDAQGAGYATLYGCGTTVPTASNLNYATGQTIANNTIVDLSPTGSVCVYVDAEAQLLLDVNGYLPAGSAISTASPARLLDTRQADSTVDGLHAGGGPAVAASITSVQITGRAGVPSGATAAIVNLTVVGPERAGFATLFPCTATLPTSSTVNYADGDIPNGAIAPLSPEGALCVFTDASAHLLVDVAGYLPAGTTVGSLPPARLLDTRQPDATIDGLHSGGGPVPAGSTIEIQIAGRGGVPTDATTAILNVATVGAQAAGYATVYDCTAQPPTASNVNYVAGRDIANNTISKLSAAGTICVYTSATAEVLVDVSGFAV
jgi:alpha-tubulin suppressor-like RCC1 family protein